MIFDNADRQQLLLGADELIVKLTDGQADQMLHYAEMLYEINASINMTRVPASSAISLHFLDSLSLCSVISITSGMSILDVGTGAGFPGLVLGIAFSDVNVVLMDATRKRLSVLNQIISDLGITNVSTYHGRAEANSDNALLSAFDIVTARAVAKTEILAGWMLPYVRKDGVAVAYKSLDALEEINGASNAISAAGGTLDRIERIKIPTTDIVRLLAIMRRNNTAAPNFKQSQYSVRAKKAEPAGKQKAKP